MWESTGDWWIPLITGQWCGKRFHAMMSSYCLATTSSHHSNARTVHPRRYHRHNRGPRHTAYGWGYTRADSCIWTHLWRTQKLKTCTRKRVILFPKLQIYKKLVGLFLWLNTLQGNWWIRSEGWNYTRVFITKFEKMHGNWWIYSEGSKHTRRLLDFFLKVEKIEGNRGIYCEWKKDTAALGGFILWVGNMQGN